MKKRPRPVRDSRLPPLPTSAAETLAYEVRSLTDAHSEYQKYRRRASPRATLENITLEAFLLHARVLRDFLLGTSFCNDILAIDFFLRGACPTFDLPLLIASRHRLDTRLAHPSYDRETSDEDWDVDAIQAEILVALRCFLKGLDEADPAMRNIFKEKGF